MAAATVSPTALRLGSAGLVVLGPGLAVLGLATKGPRLHTTDFAFLSTDPRPSISAHNSPAVAVNPLRPAEPAMADKIDTPTTNCTVSVSTDDDERWDPADPVPPDPATRTCTVRSVTDRTFDSRIGFGSSQGMSSLGQQLGVVWEPHRALTFWSDTGKGTLDDNNQELALAIVAVQQGRGRRWPLVGAGGVVLLVGLAVAVGSARQPSAAKPKSR